MIRTFTVVVSVAICGLFAAAPLRAQTNRPDEVQPARAQVVQIPIGAIVKIHTRGGGRLKAVLVSVDDMEITVKPVTRRPESSRRVAFDQIERIERCQDRVNIGKYAGVGSGIGALVLFLLIAGL